MSKVLLLMRYVLLLGCLPVIVYGVDQHQVMIYTGVGYSKQMLDTYQNIYDTPSISTGLGYRWNKFISRESINYFSIGLSIGGGMVFPQLRNSQNILNYNSFLELELFAGYGVGLGKSKQHQMSILGVSFLPKLYGLLERDNFTQVGGTEVEWYNGYYIPISVGVYLPSYRYVHNRFFVGFQHSVNFIVYGNQNLNVPKENLILSSLGYQFRLEFGLNYDNFSSGNNGASLQESTVFIETNRNGMTISLFAKIENKEAKTVTVEFFALKNEGVTPELTDLIGYASIIPVFNEQAQFTKHWKGKNYFEEEIKEEFSLIYVVIKEIDENNKILIEHFIYKNLVDGNVEDQISEKN